MFRQFVSHRHHQLTYQPLIMFCVHVSHDSWLFFILQDFGGSAKVAKELYNMLQPKNADFVAEEELRERLDHVLKLYLKKKDDDKSGLKSTQNFLD